MVEVKIKLRAATGLAMAQRAAANNMTMAGYIEWLLEEGVAPELGIPIPEVRFMVFQGVPEVFADRRNATERAHELASDDRDHEPFTVASTCEALLSETYVLRDLGVCTKKLSEVEK